MIDRSGIGGEQVGQQARAVRAQRGDEQVRLGRVVRVHRALAHAGRRRDVGHPGAVIPPGGEDLGGCLQQPLTRVGSGDASDAAHPRIKQTVI